MEATQDFASTSTKVVQIRNLIADRECAAIHWQIDSVYKVGLIRCQKNHRLGDVHRDSPSPGEVSDQTIFGNCFLADRRTDAVGRDLVDTDTL